MISDDFRCFPMFSAVFRCFPTVFRLFSDDVFRLLKSSSSWSKLSMMGPQLFSGWYQMILDVFQCSQLFSDVFRLFSDDVFRLLKSSSNWTKSSMMGPQLFLGWCQMILDVFRCSQLFSEVFIWVVTFIKSLPVQCITTPCAHILWSSLYEVWQDQDASVGNQIGPNSTT